MSRHPHMREFEVERKPQRYEKRNVIDSFFDTNTGKPKVRDAESWGKMRLLFI